MIHFNVPIGLNVDVVSVLLLPLSGLFTSGLVVGIGIVGVTDISLSSFILTGGFSTGVVSLI